MKLERLFEVKDCKLYRIGGDEYPVSNDTVKKIKWSSVEGSPEEYNEEYLASLRDELKSLEEKGVFIFIEGEYDKDASNEQYTACMKHTARRIKDCVSVIGFAIPSQILSSQGDTDFFISELSAKHAQYCFFAHESVNTDIVRY